MPYSAYVEPDLILWDVVEEHFDEAAFLFGGWESALYSAKFTLTALGKIERRLEAHADGLLVGGPEVAKRVLDAELAKAEEPARATVAALALLLAREEEVARRVLDSALSVQSSLQQALVRALELVSFDFLDRMLLVRCQEAESVGNKALLLDLLTRRGVDAVDLNDRKSALSEERMMGAVLDAAGRFGRRDLIDFVEEHLKPEDSLRAKALKASLALNSREGWRICREWARETRSGSADSLRLVALLGRPEDHDVVYAQLENPARCELALSALGFCGTREAGDACLNYVGSKNERLAKAAAEAMAWIGGFDSMDGQFHGTPVEPGEEETLPPLEQDDLDADLTPDVLDDLPLPNGAVIADWWAQHRGQFAPGMRHVLGRPCDDSALLHALEAGSTWRRQGVALEIEIRSGGRQHISTDAFSAQQRRQMAAFAGQAPRKQVIR